MARGSIATVFAHTLLHQIVYSSSAGKAKSIAATFLKSLLGEHITRRRLSHFNKNDSLSMTVQNILDVPDNELYRALVEATRITEIQELSIIIDGIDINVPEGAVFVQNFYSLLQHMLYSVPKSKVLLTGIQNMDLQKPLSSLPWVCIEYDKERKGVLICLSLAQIIAN
jgi:hypothetical protein